MRFASFGLSLAFALCVAQAQTPHSGGILTVTVADQSGAIIQGAHVVARSTDGVPMGAAEADRTGEVRLSLKQGDYELSVTARGFAEHRGPVKMATLGYQNITLKMALDSSYDGGYQGPCCFVLPDLAPMPSEPLTVMIAGLPPPPVLILHSMSWKKFRNRR
jgi:hypothetical protein